MVVTNLNLTRARQHGESSHNNVVANIDRELVSISPGSTEQQSAYCSELVGLIAIIDCLHYFCEEHRISEGKITIGYDGISAPRIIQQCKTDTVTAK